jgi:hypothetical protein
MRTHTRKFILTAVSALAILLLCPKLQAITAISNMTLTGSGFGNYAPAFEVVGTAQTHNQVTVGPYTDLFSNYFGTGQATLQAFCLDLNVTISEGPVYPGTLYTLDSLDTVAANMSLQQAEEVSFLASYALYLGAPDASLVQSVEGPIQMAIWQIMGTLGATPPDTSAAAETYVSTAQAAYLAGLIQPLNNFAIWAANPAGSAQRFVIAVQDDALIRSAVPEPGTMVFLGTGVLLMALSRIRRRQ